MRPVDLTRFDFYPHRFLYSESVQQMSQAEVGQYFLLLCHAWMLGKDASLPTNPVLLARYARCEKGEKVSDLVMSKWAERDGRLYNERLSEEWEDTLSRYEEYQTQGRKGGQSASEAKVRAARENGKHGGRPSNPKTPSVSETEDNPTQPNEPKPNPCHASAVQTNAVQTNAMPMAAEPPQSNGTGTGNSTGSTIIPSESTGMALAVGNGTQPRPKLGWQWDEEEDMVIPPGMPGSQRGGPASTRTIILARLLYAALPQDKKDEAADKWEELWAKDIQTLLDDGETSAQIEEVLRALPRLARIKFVYRGDSFVSMYPKLKADVVKLNKKKSGDNPIGIMEEILAKKERGVKF